MIDLKSVEQKLKDALKQTDSVPILYTMLFDGNKVYFAANVYLIDENLKIEQSGSDGEEDLKDFLKYFDRVNSEIYFAKPGDRIL